MSLIDIFVMKLWMWYKAHNGVSDAHHTKYTDAEAVDAVNTDDQYLKKDGSETLTSDWDIGDARKIITDTVSARDGAGLNLHNSAGNGVFVDDDGNVGVATTDPIHKFDVHGDLMVKSAYDRVFGVYGFGAGHRVHFRFSNTSNEILAVPGDALKYLSYHGHQFYRGHHTQNREVARFGLGYSSSNSYFVGRVGFYGVTSPTAAVDIATNIIRIRTRKTPATSGSAGNQGDICWDSNYIYVCTSPNTWKRTALSTW